MFLQCSTMKSIGEKAKRPPVTAVSLDQNTMQPWGTLCSKKKETHSLLWKKKCAVTVSAVIFMIISSSTSSSCKQVTFSVDSPGNCRTGGGEKGVCKEVQHLILEQQEYTKYHRGKQSEVGIVLTCWQPAAQQVIWQRMSPSSTVKLDELVKHPLLDKPAQCFCLKALETVWVSLNPLQTPPPQHCGDRWWGPAARVWTGSTILRLSEDPSGEQMIQKIWTWLAVCPSAVGGLFIIHDSAYQHLLATACWQHISAAMSR